MYPWEDYAKLVEDELNNAGSVIPILDKNFSQISSTVGIITAPVVSEIPQSLIGTANAVFFTVPNTNLTTDNYLSWQGETYNILSVETTDGAGFNIISKVFASTGA